MVTAHRHIGNAVTALIIYTALEAWLATSGGVKGVGATSGWGPALLVSASRWLLVLAALIATTRAWAELHTKTPGYAEGFIDGSVPFHPKDAWVKVTSVRDSMGDARFIGMTGQVVGHGDGQTIVLFGDGSRDSFWPEELVLIANATDRADQMENNHR